MDHLLRLAEGIQYRRSQFSRTICPASSSGQIKSLASDTGIVREKKVVLNPGRRRLQGGELAVVIGTSQQAVDLALAEEFSAAAPLEPSPIEPDTNTNATPSLRGLDALVNLGEASPSHSSLQSLYTMTAIEKASRVSQY